MAGERKERRYRRVQLKESKWVAVQGAGRRGLYRCTAMGLGGVFPKCRDPLPKGSVVRFAFELGYDTIRGTANVRDTAGEGMGLAFLSLRVEDRGKINAFIQTQTKK